MWMTATAKQNAVMDTNAAVICGHWKAFFCDDNPLGLWELGPQSSPPGGKRDFESRGGFHFVYYSMRNNALVVGKT